MAVYTLAWIKPRITSTAVHVDFKSVFGAAFKHKWFVFSTTLVLFATKCDFCSARLINKVNTREQQNTSVFRQTARPINTKILGNRVERSGPKHKAPRTVLVTIPDDVNYACMKCLPLLCHGR